MSNGLIRREWRPPPWERRPDGSRHPPRIERQGAYSMPSALRGENECAACSIAAGRPIAGRGYPQPPRSLACSSVSAGHAASSATHPDRSATGALFALETRRRAVTSGLESSAKRINIASAQDVPRVEVFGGYSYGQIRAYVVDESLFVPGSGPDKLSRLAGSPRVNESVRGAHSLYTGSEFFESRHVRLSRPRETYGAYGSRSFGLMTRHSEATPAENGKLMVLSNRAHRSRRFRRPAR
jgi:hypothetical protein